MEFPTKFPTNATNHYFYIHHDNNLFIKSKWYDCANWFPYLPILEEEEMESEKKNNKKQKKKKKREKR